MKSVALVTLGLVILSWALTALFVKESRLAFISAEAQIGVEAASALARLFGAFVVGFYAVERPGGRLPWVAAALSVLGFGSLVFGYGELLFKGVSMNADEAAYEALGVWTVAGILLALGLVPRAAPPFTKRTAVVFAFMAVLFATAADFLSEYLPDRMLITGLRDNAPLTFASGQILPEVTSWHLVLSTIPLLLAVAAMIGAVRAYHREEVRGWVLVALVFFVGAQLHALYWPPGFGPILAASDVLRLSFAGTVIVGGLTEIGSLARERARLLEGEEERRRRLEELSSMKADFVSMVAHEFASPLFATRGYAEMLASERLRSDERKCFLGKLRAETDKLEVLVDDVRASTAAESANFSVSTKVVSVENLLSDAAFFVNTLPGAHPVEVLVNAEGDVWADPGRIGQVLCNLIKNAAAYSPDGSKITLEASRASGAKRTRFAVSDLGEGVHPDESDRIFEKFVRGSEGGKSPGIGLGLYLSRQIVRTHGSDLRVDNRPGGGSVFYFELESVARKQES